MQTDAIAIAPIKEKCDAVPDLNLANLFEQHYPRIYNYLRYRVRVKEDAEDLIGTIFEQAFKNRASFDPNKGTFSAWLFRIARNELVSHHRKQRNRLALEIDAEFPTDLVTTDSSPENQLVQKETMRHLLQCLDRLSERDQEIISLKFAGRLRNKEIGEIMELKEKTVSVVLLRAVRRLRKEMEKESA